MDNEERLKHALIGMCDQYLRRSCDVNIYTHDFMSAGENALELLAELGVMETDDNVYYVFK